MMDGKEWSVEDLRGPSVMGSMTALTLLNFLANRLRAEIDAGGLESPLRLGYVFARRNLASYAADISERIWLEFSGAGWSSGEYADEPLPPLEPWPRSRWVLDGYRKLLETMLAGGASLEAVKPGLESVLAMVNSLESLGGLAAPQMEGGAQVGRPEFVLEALDQLNEIEKGRPPDWKGLSLSLETVAALTKIAFPEGAGDLRSPEGES
jgi:hypothetical protein